MSGDLRRRALEGGKTTSNKAKSRQSSRASSRGNSKPASRSNSRPNSRIPSGNVSDDEENAGFLSDDTNQSINSIDALLDADDMFNESATDSMKVSVSEAIKDVLDRKGSSTLSRTEDMARYVRALTSHHMADAIYGRIEELIEAFNRSVKADTTEEETRIALRAIAVTAISFPENAIFEHVKSPIKRAISDASTNKSKNSAIHCFGTCLVFGGAGEEEFEDALTFLLEIVSSDGSFVNAEDSAEVVTAALQEYGFLATYVDDLENDSEDAVAAFLEQLDSSDVNVQIAAGQNIALLYEKSYTEAEEDETVSDLEDHADADSSSSSDDAAGDHLVKRYNAYHNPAEVIDGVSALAGLSTKAMNRRDKQNLHRSFASIAMTVKNPKIGLQTNKGKMTVRIHQESEMKVDKWWKFMRLSAMRRLLATGFVNHYYEDKQVLDALPVILRDIQGERLRSPKQSHGFTKASKGRYRDSRRFVSAEIPD